MLINLFASELNGVVKTLLLTKRRTNGWMDLRPTRCGVSGLLSLVCICLHGE
uniref:Uncharacterized protein n=1 Tax=Arundo donax TaxID=35708 RepID=A0A0A8YZY5_ARUDO